MSFLRKTTNKTFEVLQSFIKTSVEIFFYLWESQKQLNEENTKKSVGKRKSVIILPTHCILAARLLLSRFGFGFLEAL